MNTSHPWANPAPDPSDPFDHMGLGWFLLVLATLATLLSAPGTGAFAPCSNASRALGCGDPQWIVPDGALKCSTFGSDPCASELVASGSSACAYQEMRVVPYLPCQISGGLYALATCVGTCTPLVVVCSGKYLGKLHHPAAVVASVVSQLRFADNQHSW